MTTREFDFDAAQHLLLGDASDEIIDLIFRLNTGQGTGHPSARAKDAVIRQGWVRDGERLTLTPLGISVADSIREYVFWIRRGRRLHCEGQVAHLSAAHYAGKSVLEIGCGFGCNLIPIAQVAKRAVGIEPSGIYRAMGAILCAREQIQAVEIHPGSGEQIPMADKAFDVVLCVSAHQYMDVRAAIHEMVRVLAPGGELQIVGGTLGTYMRTQIGPVLQAPRRSFPYAITILNTLSYMGMGKRAYQRAQGPSTSYPIYPPQSTMTRWLTNEGLRQNRPSEPVGPETCFSFQVPAA